MASEIITAFFLGMLATAAPCVLPLYPGFLAYLSASGGGKVKVQYLGFLVFLGVLTMMIVLGLIISLLSVAVGSVISIITPLADIIIILIGILLLMNKNIFASLPKTKNPLMKNPYANAYSYGLLYGPVALPCSGPFLVSIFAISFTAADFFSGLLLFFVFGLGFGVPLFLISLVAKARQQWLIETVTKHQEKMNRIAGSILILVGAYDLYINWQFLTVYL
ncbi:MAG: cytochrome c biogenesis protein CcdA [Candidatus Aenigmarchaeota archaeon]|nr:cytochrome c biogenesis protein CcdA [Candidatus Aenigmarchaeota archaeon]